MGKLTEEQKARKKQLDAETKAAKQALGKLTQSEEWSKIKKTIPKDAVAGIERLALIPGVGGGNPAFGKTMNDQLDELFGKVGTTLSELDVFKATKMGRRELQKKVREALQRSIKTERRWIAFNEGSESWTYMGKGETPPKGFPEDRVPNFKVKDNPDYVAGQATEA